MSLRHYLASPALAILTGWSAVAIENAFHAEYMALWSIVGAYVLGSVVWIGIALADRRRLLWRLLLLWVPTEALIVMFAALATTARDADDLGMGALIWGPTILAVSLLCLLATGLLFKMGSRPKGSA